MSTGYGSGGRRPWPPSTVLLPTDKIFRVTIPAPPEIGAQYSRSGTFSAPNGRTNWRIASRCRRTLLRGRVALARPRKIEL